MRLITTGTRTLHPAVLIRKDSCRQIERVSVLLRVKRGQLEACSIIGAVQEIGGVERPPIVACTRTCLQCQNA